MLEQSLGLLVEACLWLQHEQHVVWRCRILLSVGNGNKGEYFVRPTLNHLRRRESTQLVAPRKDIFLLGVSEHVNRNQLNWGPVLLEKVSPLL